MRECGKCGKVRPDDMFSWRDKAKGHRHTYCKQCISADNKARRQRGKRSGTQAKKDGKRDRLKALVDIYKSSIGCQLCGYNKCPEAMDLHHIDPELKESSISALIQRAHDVASLLFELEKCAVLCATCHREVHAGVASVAGGTDDDS